MQIQTYREKLGMTQEELALESGLSLNMIQSLESGRRVGSVKTIITLANILHVSTDEILRDNITKGNNSEISG